MLKKSLVCGLLLGVVAIALASSGGGRKKSSLHSPIFSSLRPSSAFTLKSKSEYSTNLLFNCRDRANTVTYKSVVTYQKGNMIYVMPAQYKLINPSRLSFKNNLNAVDLKIRLPR